LKRSTGCSVLLFSRRDWQKDIPHHRHRDRAHTVVVRHTHFGAPNGFVIEWMTLADFIANGNQWPDIQPKFARRAFPTIWRQIKPWR
jgi:hypothetical protein